MYEVLIYQKCAFYVLVTLIYLLHFLGKGLF